MKRSIFWFGVLGLGVTLELAIVSSPWMFHFAAMVLLLLLFRFRHPVMFVLGTGILGAVIWLTSITPLGGLIQWLGVWGLGTLALYGLFPRAYMWPIPVAMAGYRVCQYLFSQPSLGDILRQEELWLSTILNIGLAAILALWFARIKLRYV